MRFTLFSRPVFARANSLLPFAAALALAAVNLQAQSRPSTTLAASDLELLELSLEELGQVKVTTVSRKSQTLSETAAAVYVVTQEEIRRSGVNGLADVFRTVPGMEVAQANSHQWAITARGFNSIFANKLLVLMDGRTIYTPSFSGVYWEDTDTVLEDIDRIEVVRGPGATLWGANAVNGVINIITKSSRETQGVLLSGGGGSEERGFGTVRYGGQLKSNLFYRVYGKFNQRDDFTRANGQSALDDWWRSQSGFRMDWHASEASKLTLQGDYYYGELDGLVLKHSLAPVGLFPAPARLKSEGGNLLARLERAISEDSDLSVQVFYDRTDRHVANGREIRDTIDLDAQHRFALGSRHEIVWGGGYRYSADKVTQTPDLFAADPETGLQLFSAFVQDEIALALDRLHLTLGTKIEHHDFTGFEVQPSGRIAWVPHERHTLWAAVSRAVRTPSRSERGFGIYWEPPPGVVFPLPVLIRGIGNPDFDSEDLIAYELGYRVIPHERLTVDAAVFYNDYDNLWAATALPAEFRLAPQPHLFIPGTVRNDLTGESYGTELSTVWQPLDNWRLRAAYGFFKLNLHTEAPVRSITEDTESDDPQQQFSLWSDVDLGRHVELGLGLRYVDDRRALGVSDYTAFDARLAWKPSPNCEISIVGRNLLDPHHKEAAPQVTTVRDVEVDRSVFAKLTLRF